MFFSNLNKVEIVKILSFKLISFVVLMIFLLELNKYQFDLEYIKSVAMAYVAYKTIFYLGLASLQIDNFFEANKQKIQKRKYA